LQGVPDFHFGDVLKYACYKAMGDAVCVPVLEFLIANVLNPSLVDTETGSKGSNPELVPSSIDSMAEIQVENL
jgi:hypothetical protein